MHTSIMPSLWGMLGGWNEPGVIFTRPIPQVFRLMLFDTIMRFFQLGTIYPLFGLYKYARMSFLLPIYEGINSKYPIDSSYICSNI